MLAFARELDSETMAQKCFNNFFVPNGLLRLVLIDPASENKGDVICMCENIGIIHCVVAPEDHDAILNEWFHRYLNKVEAIHAAEMTSFSQWELGALFASYAWNASPVDGTDVICSIAAKFREFPFPLDIAEPDAMIWIP